MTTNFHLMTEARKAAEGFLATKGIICKGKTDREVLIDYFSIIHKLIKNKNRKVVMASHLPKLAERLKVEDVIKEIERRILNGEDINPYLSKGALRPSSHDPVLNEWKLNHLHLENSKDKPSDYFNSRAKWLLFVHVDDETVYFVDIRDHNENVVFAKKEFIRIIRDNWTEIHDKFLLGDGSMQLTDNLNEQDIDQLRRAGVSTITQVDGLTYSPGLGSTTSGESVEVMRSYGGFHRKLLEIQKYLDENEGDVKKEIELQTGASFDAPFFTIELVNGLFRVFEKKSQSYLGFTISEL